MIDENYASASTTTVNATGLTSPAPDEPLSTSNEPPPAFAFRRAATLGPPSQLRRRLNGIHPPSSADNQNAFTGLRRRSSTYSDYLESSADDLLNPSKSNTEEQPKSLFVYIPLTLALLPAIAGLFFENGSAFFTDLILLTLAAVFLHWSVTQPWDWYHSAQQIRIIQDEALSEEVFESDSDFESAPTSASVVLEDVPEEKGKGKDEEEPELKIKNLPTGKHPSWDARQRAAVKELYIHEIIALAWCFIFPMLSAYLLHMIRGQLSRPSEGLVSDYNLTIFIMAAEVRPVSHLIRMLQMRTLHVQAIVAQNPHIQKTITSEEIQALSSRLDELEARSASKESATSNGLQPEASQKLVESTVGREFRKSVQPELEALNRAMRRYEKKLTVLANQTDNKIEYVEYRLNDALALAAVAAKNSNSRRTLVGWFLGRITVLILLPLQAMAAVILFPFRTVSTLVRRNGQHVPERAHRPLRNGKNPAQGRSGPDRVSVRVSRK
ncbi:hypothetical protein F5B22DRAFT_14287 [Xylaria bambusicola]|uniref:uncharacterized protein n=1 Tax=Xylaria bambusicola TaxID=326684 RepID=UPI0020089BB4|nr:uncharacterized protein F5B22DRAFT_14287 [Xylaria bambusicola]KAI0527981.1 hypothetical protein F5B22DRAFT_14287 [Xylaria bambusicola]